MRHAWDASANLQRLYRERIEPRMTQKEFGRKVGISQAMVAQILSGDRSLPLDLAPEFARELNCTIYDICPEMGDYVKEKLLPVLGKALRRAAVVLMAIVAQQLQPSDALASTLHNPLSGFLSSSKSLSYYTLWAIIHFVREIVIKFMGLVNVSFASCRVLASTTSAWLRRYVPLSRRLSPVSLQCRRAAAGSSSRSSLRSSSAITRISSRPFATQWSA